MKKEIEAAIRQHLIITNDPGVKYAVDRIMSIFEAKRKEDTYLNSLIEKATPAWKDVDVDKFMGEIR